MYPEIFSRFSVLVEIVVILHAEFGREFLRHVIGNIETEWIPECVHLPPLLLGRPSASPVPFEEECLHRSLELVKLFLRSDVFGELRHEFGPLPFVYRHDDPVLIAYRPFPDWNHISWPDWLGRLGVGSVYPYFSALAGIGGVTSRLEYPDRPQVFVYSRLFCHTVNLLISSSCHVFRKSRFLLFLSGFPRHQFRLQDLHSLHLPGTVPCQDLCIRLFRPAALELFREGRCRGRKG